MIRAFGSVVVPGAGGYKAEVSMPPGTAGEFVVTCPGFHYVVEGTIRTGFDGSERIVTPGTLMVIPPGPRRMFTFARTRVISVGLHDGDFSGRFAVEPSYLPLSARRNDEWEERLRALAATPSQSERLDAVATAAALRHDEAERRAGRRMNLTESILAFLGESLDRAPALAELSERFGYAPNHLNDVVSASTGRSIRQWTIGFRLEAARLALRRRHESIAAVASSFGFEPAYFARRFAARYRLSPAAWRAADAPASDLVVAGISATVNPYGIQVADPAVPVESTSPKAR